MILSTFAARPVQRRELRFFDALCDFVVLLTGRSHLPPTKLESACLGRWKARWGARTLSSLKEEEVQRYFAELSQRGATERDLRMEHALLRALYRWAGGCGWAEKDPTLTLDRTRALVKSRAVHWTPVEQRRLLEKAKAGPAYLSPLLLLGLRTGLRLGHLLNLEWRHVDLLQGKISIPANEVASGQAIHISLDLDARGLLAQLLLKALASPRKSARALQVLGLPLWKGRPDHRAVLGDFRAVRRAAGIPDGDFDSLRLTFARNCAKACVPMSYPLRVSDWEDPSLVQKVYEEAQSKRVAG